MHPKYQAEIETKIQESWFKSSFYTEGKLLVWDLTFQTSSEVTKKLDHVILFFLGNDTKKWFLTNSGRDNNTQGVHEHSKFW